jgi:hypothetical protein
MPKPGENELDTPLNWRVVRAAEAAQVYRKAATPRQLKRWRPIPIGQIPPANVLPFMKKSAWAFRLIIKLQE